MTLISMETLTMDTHAPDVNEKPRSALTMRMAFLFGAIFFLMSGNVQAGWFKPDVRTFESCAERAAFSAEELKQYSRSSELYFSLFLEDGKQIDHQLFYPLGVVGMVASMPLARGDQVVDDDVQVRFTGTVYKRKASAVERFFGGGQDRIMYELEVFGAKAIVSTSSLTRTPLPVCRPALDA